jgi:hypothetical protein
MTGEVMNVRGASYLSFVGRVGMTWCSSPLERKDDFPDIGLRLVRRVSALARLCSTYDNQRGP